MSKPARQRARRFAEAPRAPRWFASPSRSQSLIAELADRAAVGLRSAIALHSAEELVRRVASARESWTHDFHGAQFSLGRAFYTHLETGRSSDYFREAAASDALVERVLPGMQAQTLELLGAMLGASVRRRAGFCGPGVHVFPAGGEVARRGGVVHFDLEGLTDHDVKTRRPAVTLVVMLAPGLRGGGLRLFARRFDGRPDTEIDPTDIPARTVRSGAGDALLIDSYRLHQIRPFSGARDRVSITVHAVEKDRGMWEAWF